MTNNYENGVDLNRYYGIDGLCENNVCSPSNVISPQYTRPSIEEIANYQGGEELYPIRPDIQQQFNTSTGMNDNLINQMYQPITQAQAREYPTPAIVRAEAQQQNMNNSVEGFITDYTNPYPVTRENLQYLNGFIRTQIGRRISIDFLIGSNNMVTKTGYLLAVATNYILINELDTNDITACDFYNIKFIRFYY